MGETTKARPSLNMIIRTLNCSGITVEGVADDGDGARLAWELPAEFGPDAYKYSRKFGPFHEVLQMKMGRHLVCLADDTVAGRDLDLLYDAASKNTELLHCDVDVMAHPETGAMLWSFKGETNLVASKLPFLPAAIRRGTAGVSRAGEADAIGHGMLFADPADSTGMPGTWFMHWDDWDDWDDWDEDEWDEPQDTGR
ncbi:hypothetical protein [Corynebacterium xerosis]|uniref:hypothetical protein n=1 Tax=Corynebacterium xerosis TaxID=1725 RepID=UPI0036716D68